MPNKIPPQHPSVPDTKLDPESEGRFTELYQDEETQDLQKLVKESKRRRAWLISVVLLCAAAGLMVAGFWFFNGQTTDKFGEDSVKLELRAPLQVPSGQEVEYRLAYVNDQTVAIKRMEINLRFPSGFTMKSAEPSAENAEGTRFLLRDIGKRASGEVVVRGQMIGNVGEIKEAGAVVVYEPANISAQFSRVLSASTTLVASAASITLTAPDKAALNQPYKFFVLYRNTSEATLSGLALKLSLPVGFSLELPKLAAVPEQANVWQLPDIAPQAEAKLEFSGSFGESALLGAQELRAAIGLQESGGAWVLQEERVAQVALTKQPLALTLTANEAQLTSAAELGQTVEYEVRYVNESEQTFSHLVITVSLDGRYFDWATFRDDAGGRADGTKGTVEWTEDGLPLLESVAPGARGSLRFMLRLNRTLPAGVTSGAEIRAAARAVAAVTGSGSTKVTVDSNEVNTKLSTTFTLATEARYFTDDLVKVGSGPLPPQVGQTTTYLVYWSLGNSLNEVENVAVTTTLPLGVSWTGQTSVTAGQNVTYNANTREVRWLLNRLPAGAGASFAKPQAFFEVAIAPVDQDVDKVLVLAKTSTATAVDTYSGANLIATSAFVTTDLEADAAAQGKGVVIR